MSFAAFACRLSYTSAASSISSLPFWRSWQDGQSTVGSRAGTSSPSSGRTMHCASFSSLHASTWAMQATLGSESPSSSSSSLCVSVASCISLWKWRCASHWKLCNRETAARHHSCPAFSTWRRPAGLCGHASCLGSFCWACGHCTGSFMSSLRDSSLPWTLLRAMTAFSWTIPSDRTQTYLRTGLPPRLEEAAKWRRHLEAVGLLLRLKLAV
mmetsp:Transcript_25298/g.45777  ORF Transcript_25298/g.45777 Transcript_25298/m.45777 type:complete len:212 (-) Transcript_25298:127-762(-)